ncbi:hypothetical protein ACFW3Z_09140 [Nocardiopsis alba]|uniref:hypothetical protein n=1 Tax=Nocardiopsis alba TaxID=53437 RepID=UPI0033A05D09
MTERPMTVYVAPVGVSLFDDLLSDSRARLKDAVGKDGPWRNIFQERDDIHNEKAELKDPRAEADRVSERLIKETSDQGTARESLESLIEKIKPEEWPASLSAELSSLASDRHGKHRLGIGTGNDEMVLLIASDTGKGLRAALFNALAMTEGDLDRVDYLPDADTPLQIAPGRVAIIRLSGLDAEDSDRFLDAMRELSGFGPHFEKLMENPGSTCRFHLTGGFRVAMPFLMAFAEALRSLYGGRVSAHARYEFSSSDRSIELPLSSPPKNRLKGMLSGFDENGYRNKVPPKGGAWEGYAYEHIPETNRWRLNPFGMALRELLPETQQEP